MILTHYDWLKRINPDEPKRANFPPVPLTPGSHQTDADILPPSPSQDSNSARQPKNKFSHCSNHGNGVETDSSAPPAKCNQGHRRPGTLALGLTPRDVDNIPPPLPNERYGARQPQHKFSRFSSSGNKGMIDSPNDYDELNEEVIYSQGSTKVCDVFTDHNWDLDRIVEYESPLKRKEILSPGNNSSHWNRNKNNSSVMTNNHPPRRNETTKNQIKKSR